MGNIGSYLLASAYSGFSPLMNMAAATCSVNGEKVPCPGFGTLLGIFGGFFVLYIGILVLMLAANWRIYSKAGHPGWASLIPVYNIVVLLEIVGKPTWWVILCFIPLVNIVVGIIVIINLAKAFGKSGGYAAGLIFLPFIFYPMLGFGQATYTRSSVPSSVPFPNAGV